MKDEPRRALVVAAHPDDEVLGCGGTLARLAAHGWQTHALILAEGATSRDVSRDASARADELRGLALSAERAHRVLATASLVVGDLPDNRMDTVALLDVVKRVESAVNDIRPTRVFTHHQGDVNVDHRVTHEAVQAACRPLPGSPVRELYFFEVASSTEWRASAGSGAFQPSGFFDVTDYMDAKQAALACYEAEMRDWPHPRSHEAISALAAWRGATVGVAAAEAFEVGRILR